jgi:uncharacterized protein YciI
MPLFAIVAQDRPDAGSLRADTRPRHLVHLEAIAAQTVVAGPMLSDSGAPTGSIIVADFADLAAAQAFAAADPYAQAGLFGHVAVTAFRQVFP